MASSAKDGKEMVNGTQQNSHDSLDALDHLGDPVASEGTPSESHCGCETQQRSESVVDLEKQKLAVAKCLPDEIEQRSLDLESNLLQDQDPQSTVARILWQDVARQAAALEFVQKSENAAMRVGARNARKVAEATASGACHDVEVTADDILVAAYANEFLDKVSRYRRQRETALFRSLTLLRAITSDSERSVPKLTIEDFHRQFPDSESCEKYLRARREKSEWPCPRCDARSRKHWIKTRHCWECSRCGGQFGLRHGSVMMESPLSLEQWFLAIGMVCINHDTTAAAIAEALEINRLATARRMLAAILNAFRSPDRDQLLVGLPAFVELGTAMPERSGAFVSNLQNKKLGNMGHSGPADAIRSPV